MPIRTIARTTAGGTAALAIGLLLGGCSPIVRGRTLPPSVRAVYLPMVINRTAEPGVEEGLTRALQEELLADGRLNLVREQEADAIVRIVLTDFDRQTEEVDDDDFAANRAFDVAAQLLIEENIPGRPTIGGDRTVQTRVFYNNDPRTYTFDPEPDALNDVYMTMARQIVQEIITGEYTAVAESAAAQPTANRREVPDTP